MKELIDLITSMQMTGINSTINSAEKTNKILSFLEKAKKLIGGKEYKDIERSIPFYIGYSIGYNDVARQNIANPYFHLDIPSIDNKKKSQLLISSQRKALGYFSAITQPFGKTLEIPLQTNTYQETFTEPHLEKVNISQTIELLLTTPRITLEERLKQLRSIRNLLGLHHLQEATNSVFKQGKKAGRRIILDKTRSQAWTNFVLNDLGCDVGNVIPYHILLKINLPVIDKNITSHSSFNEKSEKYLIGYLRGFDEFLTKIENEVCANTYTQQLIKNSSATEESMELNDDFMATASQLLIEIASTKVTQQPTSIEKTNTMIDAADAMEIDNVPSETVTSPLKAPEVLMSVDNGHFQPTFFKPVEKPLIIFDNIRIVLPVFDPKVFNQTSNLSKQESGDDNLPPAKRIKPN